MSERISAPGVDWWVCVCGNEPDMGGFYPFHDGREVEPVIGGPWDGIRYFCGACYRVINQVTLEVVAHPERVTWMQD